MKYIINPYSNAVRVLASQIIDDSRDILQIQEPLIDSILKRRIEKFEQEKELSRDPYDQSQLSLEQEIGVNVFFNTVNFCFKDPDSRQEYQYLNDAGEHVKRSTGLFTALAEADVNWNNLEEVARIDQQRWLRITQITDTNPLFQGTERYKRITNFAEYLLSQRCLTVMDFLEKNNFDAIKILGQLIASKCFEDQFLKRAQVTIHNLENVLKRRTKRTILNGDTLSCMADYRIPQVFYNLGVLSLSSDLKIKLMREEIVESESAEELALRASVIVIGMKLSELMGINESIVDGLLWRMSQRMNQNGELKIPHMIVATDKY